MKQGCIYKNGNINANMDDQNCKPQLSIELRI